MTQTAERLKQYIEFNLPVSLWYCECGFLVSALTKAKHHCPDDHRDPSPARLPGDAHG